MMDDVTRIEPNTLAVFFSMDDDPGFYVKLCHDKSLFDIVHSGLFMNKPVTEDSRWEVDDVIAILRESGTQDFEDGWITLKIGMADTVAFLMEKVGEFKREELFADRERFEELKRRQGAEMQYQLLRQALIDALGDRGPEIAAKAA